MINIFKKLFPDLQTVEKIQAEASERSFFRLKFKNHSLIAMVYQQESIAEIKKITKLTQVYKTHAIAVPEIYDVIDNKIVIQQDLGKQLLQSIFGKLSLSEKEVLIQKTVEVWLKITAINQENTALLLDNTRMKYEMDFFIKHFADNYRVWGNLKKNLYSLVDQIGPAEVFAHRDFHSRNLILYQDEISLVDFQDSMMAPKYYDFVSFIFDSYLDLGNFQTKLITRISDNKQELVEQIYLTALQRNIRALGTFGFQIHEKKNTTYKKYINRTISQILNNRMLHNFLDPSIFINLTVK